MSDRGELLDFYRTSYPENWFDPRMLETGMYFCRRLDGKIVSAGGIHVYSPKYRVGTLGNIATHTLYRGKGFGSAVSELSHPSVNSCPGIDKNQCSEICFTCLQGLTENQPS